MSEKPMTLGEALEKGIAVLQEDIDDIIDEALKKRMAELKKEEIAHQRKSNDRQLEAYLDGTGLTNKKFAERLIKMNVRKDMAKNLRDEHMNLKDKQIWHYILQQSLAK